MALNYNSMKGKRIRAGVDDVNFGCFISGDTVFVGLDVGPIFRYGDLIESPQFVDGARRVLKVDTHQSPQSSGRLDHMEVKVQTEAEWNARTNPPGSAPTMNFHGSVGLVAGRDINISVSDFLKGLSAAVQYDTEAKPEEKVGLLGLIDKVSRHPIVTGLTVGGVMEVLKVYMKPSG